MSRKLDLADHVREPEGGGTTTTLQNIAQDIHDLECLENELAEHHEQLDDVTGEKAFNLSVALDSVHIVRTSLARALCLLVEWAPKLKVSTIVEIDDTQRKFIQETLSDDSVSKVDLVPNTVTPKGKN